MMINPTSMDVSMRIDGPRVAKLAFCICGVMSTLVLYGILQEKIMRYPYGEDKEYFKYSLFIVFCNRLLTCTVCAVITMNIFHLTPGGPGQVRGGEMRPVAPLYKYAAVSVSNVSATTCQYEVLKYVSFPVQTLAKSAKMIPVMMWGTVIMQKRYNCRDYLVALFVTVGCTIFFLFGTLPGAIAHKNSTEDSVWGFLLIFGYLGFDGFTSTFQDKLFKGYNMEIFNQILYVTLCSCGLSIAGLIIQGHWLPALSFITRHPDCLFDISLLSLAATTSQFFISYTIRTFGALVFATIMTTRQLISIMLSCILFGHSPNGQQLAGAGLVFGALYYKTYLNSKKPRREAGAQVVDKSDIAEKVHLLNVGTEHSGNAIEKAAI